jgi:diguanylate cyclase (GGDEF)-like protein/PAS domain S-box-containing protein
MKGIESKERSQEIDEWMPEFLFHGSCTIPPALQESKSVQLIVQLFKKLQEFIQSLGKNEQAQCNVDDLTGVSRDSTSRILIEEEKPKNEKNIQRILDTIPIALVFVKVSDNTIIYVNQKCCELFGCTREESIGRNSINYWVNRADWGEYVRQFRLQGFMKEYEVKMKRHGGEGFWALISSAIVEYNGESVNISGILDIQERKNFEIMVAESEARFRTIVETVPFPIIITRAVDDAIMYVNTIAMEIFGFINEETIGKNAVSIYVNPEERLFIGQEIRRYGCVNNREVMIKNSKEKVYYALISGAMISISGEQVILFGIQDITAMKIMEQELRKLATTDFLTNIANHRRWLEVAEQEFYRFKRYGHVSSVLVLDLDHFKLINDQFGHQTGDEVLRDFSVQCQSCLSEVDCMGRIGGEEFAILLPETGRDKAELVARKIQTTILYAQSEKDGQLVSYTVSIGITQFTAEDSSFSQVLSRADGAMYTAKQEGRNRFVSQ